MTKTKFRSKNSIRGYNNGRILRGAVIQAPRSGAVVAKVRDSSPGRTVPLARPVCQLEARLHRCLGYNYCKATIATLKGSQAGKPRIVDWEHWDIVISSIFPDSSSKSYIFIMAFFMQRVSWFGDGVEELAMLLERYCNPALSSYKPVNPSILSKLRYALGCLRVQDSPFIRSIVFAMETRHRFIAHQSSPDRFVFVPVGIAEDGSTGEEQMIFPSWQLTSEFIQTE